MLYATCEYDHIRDDKSPGFRVGYPKKPEPEVSGTVWVGSDFLSSGFFRVGYPKGVKIAGRVGFQIFGFFGHPI